MIKGDLESAIDSMMSIGGRLSTRLLRISEKMDLWT